MADQEEAIDSRTSIVGRKRARGASFESGEISADASSADEAQNVSRKRARQDDEPEAAMISDHVVSLDVASAGDVDVPTAAPSIAAELRATGWNKGVQSGGIRTSFGAKKQSKQVFQPTSAEEEIQSMVEPENEQSVIAASFQSQLKNPVAEKELSADLSLSGGSSGLSAAAAFTSQSTNVAGDIGMTGVDVDGKLSKNFNFNGLPPKPTPSEQSVGSQVNPTVATRRPQPPVLQDASKFYGDSYPALKSVPSPVCVPVLAPPAFEFRETVAEASRNPQPPATKVQQAPPTLTKAQKKAAAVATKSPVVMSESQFTKIRKRDAILATAKVLGLGVPEADKLLIGLSKGRFTKKQIGLYQKLSQQQKSQLDEKHVHLYEAGVAARKQDQEEKKAKMAAKASQSKNSQKPATQTSEPILIEDSESEANEEADDSEPYDPESAMDLEPSDAVAPPKQTNEERLAALSEPELLLQLKYFPTEDGRLYIPRCLYCTELSHATYDCPSASCTTCGSYSHSTMSCPKSQRCGKCREQGHHSRACPSKLARLQSEAVPCDHCGSLAHIESECHMIWRSFFPQPEEIKTVRSFPMDCYTCGQEGHLGPECGLYQGPGNLSWSYANYTKYVSNSSTVQVVSAGVDYTIKSKAKKNFTIKGKANDIIQLDDSDDDQAFIHTKIKAPSAPKGQIQFANLQPPSGPRGNQARDSRPDFGSSSYAPGQSRIESARMGRERSFSPPPRFSKNRSQFPPPQYQSYGGDRQGGQFQDSYRPPPESRSQPAPQKPGKKVRKPRQPKAKKGQQGGR